MNRVEELCLKLVDGDLSDSDARELERRTRRSEEDRRTFFRILRLESQLLACDRDSKANVIVSRIEARRERRTEERVIERIQSNAHEDRLAEMAADTSPPRLSRTRPNSTTLDSRTTAGHSWPRRSRIALAAAACLLISFGIRIATQTPRGTKPGTIARFTTESATINLTDNQTIRTSGALDSAEVTYADGTVVTLLGDTVLTVSSYEKLGKQIVVQSGLVQADVAKQPAGLPVRIVTPTARLEVLGTTLGIEVQPETTHLEVSSGLVAITRKSDGQRIEVSEGKFARATTSMEEQMRAAELPTLSATWSQKFDSGLPNGWRRGSLLVVDGIQAVRADDDAPESASYAVTTHNAWEEGDHALFAIEQNSVLHVQFRQQKFGRIRVMVSSRVFPAAKGRFGTNLFYTRKAWNEDVASGEWATLSIPLSEVDWFTQRRKQQHGVPDLNNMAAYMIEFATEKDIGLTLGRVWVTQNGEDDQDALRQQ